MSLDPEIAAVLDALRGMKPMEAMALEELRASVPPVPMALRPAVKSWDDRLVNDRIPVRVYQPFQQQCESLLIFFHGGGFVMGSLETHDHVCRGLCNAVGGTVMAVDYRLAPEQRFPGATDDCLEVTRWASSNLASVSVTARRIILIGDSAGANLATVTALRLAEEGGTQVSGQVLVYPVTNYHTPATQSYLDNATGYSLTRAAMIRFWDDYVSSEAQARHPHASPLLAADLTRLPPALVMTAEFDPLRDEGEAYAKKLAAAGVPVKLVRYDGLIHGFLRMAAVSARARDAFAEIGNWVKAVQ